MRAMPSPRRPDPVFRTRTPKEAFAAMAAEVREGLSRRPLPELPCKYFYDERGSELFERITGLPEYYPTRTETAILEAHAAEVVDAVAPRELAELGSGAGHKIRLFLDAMRSRRSLESVVLLEISEGYLARVGRPAPGRLPGGARARGSSGTSCTTSRPSGRAAAGCCSSSPAPSATCTRTTLPAFFRAAAAVLAPGDGFLVGVDLVKDPARLHAAYNDSAGVTAEFNLNILRVLNDRLGADFDPAAFEHVAFYDAGAAVDRDAPARARRP